MSKTKRRLIECFGKVFPEIPESDIPLATQAKVPTWDSACSVSLLTAIEEEFEIGVDEELVQSVDSFASLNSYLETRNTSGATGFSLRLHHVGFVVRDIERSVDGFKNSLGMTWDAKIYADPKQKVKVTFLATGPACAQIELVEPAGSDSPVARFLEKGGGQHHLCYEVEDIEHALATFKARKCSIVQRPCPAPAFGGRRIAWLVTPERLVVELLEAAAERGGS